MTEPSLAAHELDWLYSSLEGHIAGQISVTGSHSHRSLRTMMAIIRLPFAKRTAQRTWHLSQTKLGYLLAARDQLDQSLMLPEGRTTTSAFTAASLIEASAHIREVGGTFGLGSPLPRNRYGWRDSYQQWLQDEGGLQQVTAKVIPDYPAHSGTTGESPR